MSQDSNKENKAIIYYYDIGDYLNREDKLKIIKEFKSFANPDLPLKVLEPNEHGDWISVRNDMFSTFIQIGDKDDKSNKQTFFVSFYSNGLKTQRDAWCYNSSKEKLLNRIEDTLRFYSIQLQNYKTQLQQNPQSEARTVIDFDDSKISWTRALIWDIEKLKEIKLNKDAVRKSLYRPFYKQSLYFDKSLNEMTYQIPKLFPMKEIQNLLICVPGAGDTKSLSCLITDEIPDLGLVGASQCFPLYYYEENDTATQNLFDSADNTKKYIRRDAISDFIFERAKKQYGKNVNKEDIFYFVYGFLHSKEYREKFANDLKKMLPRLPLLEEVKDFWAFSKAGRQLAELHLNYETVAPFEGLEITGAEKEIYTVLHLNYETVAPFEGLEIKGAEKEIYTVEKMRFPKKDQKDTIIYNSQIIISNIPATAYEYVVNGKSAIEWIMERYQVTVHKESGIKNDPNDWAKETNKPRYILDLLLSIINVSMQTVEIVNNLPKVKFDE
jgi:predicted helicase